MPARKKTGRSAGSRSRAATKRLKSWSYSTYNMWKQCPRRIFLAKIAKHPDPMGPAAQRGIRIHGIAEDFIKGKVEEFPLRGPGKELRDFAADLEAIRDSPTAISEHDFTFTDAWKITHWRDWDGAWVRMKLDVFDKPDPERITVIDFKTGRRRDYEQQLELYGLGGLLAHSKVQEVTAEIWYIDEGDTDDAIEGITFERKELDSLKKTWEKRAKPLMSDTEFRARPSSTCSWCPFSKEKGGQCGQD